MKTNYIKLNLLVIGALSTLSLIACKGEKYKEYEAQEKNAKEQKASLANQRELSRSFNIQLTQGLLPSDVTASNASEWTTLGAESVNAHFIKFEELVESNPVEAAKHLTVATNPWAKSIEVSSTSSGAKYLDTSKHLVSKQVPADLFTYKGNEYQNLGLGLAVNLAQGYILDSSNFVADKNFKLVLASLLFLKKAEYEIKNYRSHFNDKKYEGSSLNKARVHAKRYLELGLSIVKYVVLKDSSVFSALNYPVAFQGFGSAPEKTFNFDIFAKESDLSMADFVLVQQNETQLLNGAFFNLGYIAEPEATAQLEETRVAVVEEIFATANPVDVSKMTNAQILAVTVKYLKHYQLK